MEIQDLDGGLEDELGLDSEDCSYEDEKQFVKKARPKRANRTATMHTSAKPVAPIRAQKRPLNQIPGFQNKQNFGGHKRASSTNRAPNSKVQSVIGRRRNTIVSEFDPKVLQQIEKNDNLEIRQKINNSTDSFSYLSSTAHGIGVFDPGKAKGDQNCTLI